MSVRRMLPRVLASAALVGVLTAAAVASAAPRASVETAAHGPGPSGPVLELDPVRAAEPEGETVAEGEFTPDPAPGAETPTGPGTPASPGSTIETAPGFTAQIRAPESSGQVAAAIAAYRASRGLPGFLSAEPAGHSGCVWGPGGSVFPGDAPASESLGAAMIRKMPGAAGYTGPAGSVAVAIITTTSFLAPDGVEYAGQTATILTKHCAVGGVAPPASPSPVEPSVPPLPPTEPSVPPEPPTMPDPVPTP